MWGRITKLAENIDSNFGADDDDGDVDAADDDNGSQSQWDDDSSALEGLDDDDDVDEGVVTQEQDVANNAESSILADNANDGDDDDVMGMEEDGWGDDDGFDDEFDFGDDDDDADADKAPSEPIENGSNGGLIHPAAAATEKENQQQPLEASCDDADAAAHADDAYNVLNDAVKDLAGEMENAATQNAATSAIAIVATNDNVPSSSSSQAANAMEEAPTTLPQCQVESPPPLPNLVTVSAPGKALIAGGYLVLEQPNPGVVLASQNCRFHSTVTFQPPFSSEGRGGGVMVVGNAVDAAWESIPLDVYSPQFDKVFSYYLSYSLTMGIENGDEEEDVCMRLQPRTGPHEPNKFVERTLLLALGYLRQSLGATTFHSRLQHHQQQQQQQQQQNSGERVALAIKLRADNDFYSQIHNLKSRGLELTPQSLEQLEPFLPCPKDEVTGDLIVNKTGMGSSAALVTSLVGALLQFFGAITLPRMEQENNGVAVVGSSASDNINGAAAAAAGDEEKKGLRMAHNLSQICHCHAQGKVGSGFDVSSAVHGSHIYTRFSKGVIHDFLTSVAMSNKQEGGKDGLQLSETLSKQLVQLVNDTQWDCTVQPITLPPGLELLMADVCGGSESPSMARKILEWKKNKRRTGFMDDYYWKDLKRCNQKVASLLSDSFTSQSFLDGLKRDGAMIISSRTAQQWKKPMPSSWHEFEGSSWDVALKLLDLRMAFLECRQNLKGMGNAAGVPVEPEEQSALADATMKLPGVVAAGVPGAGGYDALFVIYVKGPETCGGKSDEVRDEIGKLWREMSEESSNGEKMEVCPLSVRAAGSGGGLCSTKLDW